MSKRRKPQTYRPGPARAAGQVYLLMFGPPDGQKKLTELGGIYSTIDRAKAGAERAYFPNYHEVLGPWPIDRDAWPQIKDAALTRVEDDAQADDGDVPPMPGWVEANGEAIGGVFRPSRARRLANRLRGRS